MTRRTRPVHVVAVALGAAALAALTASAQQRLNVKLGLWEVTTMVQTSGMPPIDTSQLTPEQRARIEAMMSQRQGQAKPETRRECLTQERLDKLLFQDPKDTSCKQTPVTMSATSAEVKIACTGENGMSATGTVHVDAPTPETVKGQATMTGSGGGNTMNVHSTFTARWIGADCGSVK